MFKLSEVSKLLDGSLHGSDILLTGLCTPDTQHTGAICIIAEKALLQTMGHGASAYIIPSELESLAKGEVPYVVVKNIRMSLVRLINLFIPEKRKPAFMSERSSVSPSAELGINVTVSDFAVIGAGSKIGDNTTIHAGVIIGDDVEIGSNCDLFPRVCIYDGVKIGHNVRIHAGSAIGVDGFGYVPGKEHIKIPHRGNVVIGDNVEIGANATIDRGTIGSTVIGDGSKIDNLVQIAHNVVIGKHCLIASQTGISGSTTVGDYVSMGGQVGLADHLKINSFVNIAAQSGVHNELKEGESYGGYPAIPVKEWAKQVVALSYASDTRKRLISLEKEMKKIKDGSN